MKVIFIIVFAILFPLAILWFSIRLVLKISKNGTSIRNASTELWSDFLRSLAELWRVFLRTLGIGIAIFMVFSVLMLIYINFLQNVTS